MPQVATPPHRAAVALVGVLVVIVAIGLVSTIVAPTASDGGPSMAPTASAKICPDRFTMSRDGSGRDVALCASVDLAAGDPAATRLVIIIHGDARNARTYFDDVVRSADASDATGVVILAPQFTTRGDLRRADVSDDVLVWSAEGWKSGEPSRGDDEDRRFSSFEVIDRLIEAIVEGGSFPSLRAIVIAGHSAGGQFVNRYAAGMTLDGRLRALDITVSFVVANPSSYLYFDARRVDDSGVVDEPSRSDREDCPGYDRYKYGLEGRASYLAAFGRREIRDRYASRVVTYVAGALDTDPDDPSFDRSCEGRLQGPTRLARARAYHTYLGATFDAEVMEHHRLIVVPDIGHDGGAILNDPLVRPLLFGSGDG